MGKPIEWQQSYAAKRCMPEDDQDILPIWIHSWVGIATQWYIQAMIQPRVLLAASKYYAMVASGQVSFPALL